MSRQTKRKPNSIAFRAILLVLLAGSVAVFAATTTGGGARAATALVPSIEVTQTCTERVEPRSNSSITADVRNDGDIQFLPPTVDADAGTADEADDFLLTRGGGDTNGNSLLDPGETWTYTGTYNVLDEDSTNNVGADALGPSGETASDVAPCTTDVVQAPVPGVIVGVRSVRGKVLVKVPGGEFVELEHVTEIPVGSQLDTTKGTVRLTTALGGGKTNASDFFDGVFSISQRKAKNAMTTLRLEKGNFGICRSRSNASSLAAKSKRPVRRLWGSGKGQFSTRGRYSAATVRGTKWLVQDRCDGTLTRVKQGVVVVTDFRSRRSIRVRAGQVYLAKAPGA